MEEKKQEMQKEKNKNRKAFTLIELLGVITIMAVLMLVAIPAVSRIIYNSKRNTYVSTAKTITKEIQKKATNGDLELQDTETTYYVPMELADVEKAAKSPFGSWKKGYVVVTFDGDKYQYYFTSTDDSNMGIPLTPYNSLKQSSVVENIESISTNIAICGKPKIAILDITGNIAEEKTGINCFDEETQEVEEHNLVETIEQITEGVISPGDEIVIAGTEHFNVVSSAADKTVLLAKYNLYVGHNLTYANSKYTLGNVISTSDSRYGLQNSAAVGRNGSNCTAVVAFSASRYWKGADNKVLSTYGGTTSTNPFFDVNVYDSSLTGNSNVVCENDKCTETSSTYSIAYYVNQYVTRLRSMGLTVHEGRLLKVEEAGDLGCWLGASDYRCSGYDTAFVKNTLYWIGGLYDVNNIRYISTGGISREYDPNSVSSYGVRPVIVINTSEIPLLDHEYFENKPIVVY